MPLLELERVCKTFADVQAIKDVSFAVAKGEMLCLLGPSGCGKTTLLRIVAGLERVDSGKVLLDGEDLKNVPVHQRGLGLMFQEYALFPHKDVSGNVAFGLRMAGLPSREIKQRVTASLELVGLDGFEQRAVHELSGGEQQRVALARSLAPRPRLLMLDEPLGSLDRALRERLMNELRQILKSIDVTVVYVTHDQSEAFAVGDRVAIMQQGRIEQLGPPETVYRQPQSPFIARFMGMNNLIPGQIVDAGAGRIHTRLGEFETQARPDTKQAGTGEVTVLLRPEAARVVNGTGNETNRLPVRVVESSFRGAYYRLVVRHDSGTELAFEMDLQDGPVPAVGEQVTLFLQPRAINLLPPAGGDSEVVVESEPG